MDTKSFGPIILAWRLKAGLTQKEFAKKAGLSERIVGSIERQERTPKKAEIVQMCQALGKPPAELITISYRAALKEFSEIGKQQNSRMAAPMEERDEPDQQGARIYQIIDQMANLMKELYRESRADFREVFGGWLAQSDSAESLPPAGARKRRVRRKRDSAIE